MHPLQVDRPSEPAFAVWFLQENLSCSDSTISRLNSNDPTLTAGAVLPFLDPSCSDLLCSVLVFGSLGFRPFEDAKGRRHHSEGIPNIDEGFLHCSASSVDVSPPPCSGTTERKAPFFILTFHVADASHPILWIGGENTIPLWKVLVLCGLTLMKLQCLLRVLKRCSLRLRW